MAAEPARSHYTILGVGPRATSKEIRVAYLNLARALHPDRVRSGSPAERQLAERRMREVNAAYDVLGDAAKRAQYDRDRSTRSGPSSSRPSATPPRRSTTTARPPGSPPRNPERFDADPAWRDEPHFGHQSWMDDDVEISPFVAFLLHRGPLIVVLVLAAILFIGTAYAGSPDDADPSSTTTTTCLLTPGADGTGGSVVPDPC